MLQKPFDLDDLVVRVQRGVERGRAAAARATRRNGVRAGRTPDGPETTAARIAPEPVELILYVSAESPRSANAIQNIKSVLSRYRSDKVSLTICDLSTESVDGRAGQHRVHADAGEALAGAAHLHPRAHFESRGARSSCSKAARWRADAER